jgi:hypothetical protein
MRWWRGLLSAPAAIALSVAANATGTDFAESYRALSIETKKSAASIDGTAAQFKPLQRRQIFRIISWNVQTFGGNISPDRERAYAELLDHMFSRSRSSKILAVQEIANRAGSEIFQKHLPGGADRWNPSFQNTNSSQDNGFFTQRQVAVHCEEFMYAKQGEDGRWRSDPDRIRHPVRVSHMQVGSFDFTLINLHLTFQGGDTNASIGELQHVLAWLSDYFTDPNNDPDVIIAGDFNLDANTLRSVIQQWPRFRYEYGEDGEVIPRGDMLIALIDEPTSRSRGVPKNNYDHYIMTGDVFYEEYVDGSAGAITPRLLETIEEANDVYVSDHLPVSAGFYSTGVGNDGRWIQPDASVRAAAEACSPKAYYAESASPGPETRLP